MKIPFRILPVLAALGAALTASAAPALTLYANGDPSGGFGVAILSELTGSNQVGDDFALSGDVTLQGFEWWGVDTGSDFRVRLFEMDAGIPSATPLAVFDVGTLTGAAQSFPGGDVFFYSVAVPDLALGAGDYLLSIVETGAGVDWFWAASCEDDCLGTRFERSAEGLAWGPANFDVSFRVLGTGTAAAVPEPTSGPLFAAGCALLRVRRRRGC